MSQITCYNSKNIFENVKRGTSPPKATNPTLHKYNFKIKKYIFSKLSLKKGEKKQPNNKSHIIEIQVHKCNFLNKKTICKHKTFFYVVLQTLNNKKFI
jgi:hypothetical protein